MAPEDDGKFIAIDVNSADFEIDSNDFRATERLRKRQPNARMWLARIGRKAAYTLGAHSINKVTTMIVGRVNANLQIVIELRVRDTAGKDQSINAILDTRFNGVLTLSPNQIANLVLPLEVPTASQLASSWSVNCPDSFPV